MKTLTFTAVLIAATSTMARADCETGTGCKTGETCTTAAVAAVLSNPDGFYVVDLNVQLTHGDPRIVTAVGDVFRLCTRPAATPEMDVTSAYLSSSARVVSHLLVPAIAAAATSGL